MIKKTRRLHPLVNVMFDYALGPQKLTPQEAALDFDFVDPLVDGVGNKFASRFAKTPERKLLFAILEDALALASRASELTLRDLQRQRYAPVREAVGWLRGARVLPGCLSFQMVCDHLDLNSDMIRQWLATNGRVHQRRHPVTSRSRVVEFRVRERSRRRRAVG